MVRAASRGMPAQRAGSGNKKSRKSPAKKPGRSKSGRSAPGRKSVARKSTSSTRAGGNPTTRGIELLMQDHRAVQKLFKQGQRKRDDSQALPEIVRQACDALTLHADLEERYFYPLMRDEADQSDLVAEAEVEHASAKQLIAELEQMNPEDERYAATFKVLGEYVNHHIDEEETELFPRAKRAKIDLAQLVQAKQAAEKGDGEAAMRRTRSAASNAGEMESRRMTSSEKRPETSAGGAGDEEGPTATRTRSRGRGGSASDGGTDELEDKPRGTPDEDSEERAGRQGRDP